MGGKREVPSLLRKLLDWDAKVTNNILAAVVKKAGPIRKYNTTLKALEISCNGLLWFGACVVGVFVTSDKYVRQLVVNIFIALLVDTIIVAVVKAGVRRRRPTPLPDNAFTFHMVDKYSFPSGHATRAAMIATIFSAQFDLSLILDGVLYTWFLSVCASRLLFQRHHLLDIMAGIVIGWLQAPLVMVTGLWLDVDAANGIVAYLLDETYTGASYDV